MWKTISNSLDIGFIDGHIHDRLCKIVVVRGKASFASIASVWKGTRIKEIKGGLIFCSKPWL